ncbi:glycosyltransferase family 1 protein [Neobacillus sp. PS3-34]|uniref:glycosyltransferase family 1 protein n=1 Tax=Neobacillus sp. PS3-34 TaxID=3070678 RepID=UPI0027E0C6C3|nr:glycosyltransferase family 1 protein [Neobacillus sp. PS3-34]WML47798.1 glycosyltransferase family 1 protein [Neobacillus sp. PS3-34]
MGCPLRVLQVVVNMNRGGAETLIMNLYRNINRSKIQFDFLTCKDGVFDSEIKEMGGKIYRIPYISEVGHFNYIKKLNAFFSSKKEYKIVHSHLDKMSGHVLKAAKKAGIPFRISHSHNTQSEGGIAARLYKWHAGKLIHSNATNLMACSNDAARWLFNDKYQSSMILKNGIETEKFQFSSRIRQKVREELKLDNKFVIGDVGRFNHQKNHPFLIDLFNQFNKQAEDSILILVGDGSLRTEMEMKVKKASIEDKVLFLGIRSDINHLLQAFDSLVFPSLHEGLPVSLIEAQASGLPCLISNHISKEVDLGMDLVNYCSLNDKSEWIEKMRQLKKDKVTRKVSSQALLDHGYDIKISANYLEDFYQTI